MAEAERKVEGKAEAERKIEVYYLLIDREKKTALREVSYVELSPNATVARMKKCIKEEELITLPDSMFTVWRCSDPKPLSTMNRPQLVKELLDIDLTDVTKAKELAAGDAIKDLHLSDGEVLLIEVPEHIELATRRRSGESPLSYHVTNVTCMREKTILGIWKRLEENKFIWVRGTPGSGKTVLAQLLYNYLVRNYPSAKVIVVPSWAKAENQNWMSKLEEHGLESLLPEHMTVLIIDEAQTTYSDQDLWIAFFRAIGPESHRKLYVILFASYGSLVSDGMDQSPSPFPVPSRQRISLRPVSRKDGTPPVGLLFTKEEFHDMIARRYAARNQEIFDATFLDGIFDMTAGHIGAIMSCLSLIEARDRYRYTSTHPAENEQITWATFREDVPFNDLMSTLADRTMIFARGLPRRDQISRLRVYDALSTVVQNQAVRIRPDEDDTLVQSYQFCSRRGWLQMDDLGEVSSPDIVYCFASPLHQWYIEWMLFFNGNPPATPSCSILEFSTEVIRLFDPRMLSSERRLGPACIQRPPEAQYQDEFYRCSHKCFRGALTSLPEFGTKSGRVDFYVKSKRWRIELLRDGDRLAEHSERFSTTGVYGLHLPIDDHIILDCRTSRPQKQHLRLRNLYHVVFERQYSYVVILDNKCQEVASFPLTRH